MKLQINDVDQESYGIQIFEVELSPMKRRAKDALMGLIQGKGEDAPMMRQTVKAACSMALPFLGLTKPDRNSDPIEMVVLYIADQIFNALEENGLTLEGVKEEKEVPDHA